MPAVGFLKSLNEVDFLAVVFVVVVVLTVFLLLLEFKQVFICWKKLSRLSLFLARWSVMSAALLTLVLWLLLLLLPDENGKLMKRAWGGETLLRLRRFGIGQSSVLLEET
jgi:hypothetical protein